MTIKTNHSYNTEWVIAQLEHVARFGQDESGITRLAFSAADHQARQYIVELMQDIGLTAHVDAIGNIIGRYQPEGSQSEYAAVITGSHLDTVPRGGKYDGALGVLCGLAAVKDLSTRSNIKYPLEVIVFAAEESSRFNFANMGSKAMAGMANLAAWKRAEDQQGISLAAELTAIGLDIEQIGSAVRPGNSIKGFIELHIDQGQILEQDQICIGIVDKVSSPTRLKITVTGMAGHSAGAPISQRQDALVSAAMIVLAVRDIAVEYDYQGTVATVTILNTYPGVIHVIPGTVEMWVDIRGLEHEHIITILQDIKDAVSMIADDHDTPVAIEVVSSEKPIILDQSINRTVEEVCNELKLTSLQLDSRAGHDAMNMARCGPAGLILIPCKEGISHCDSEYVDEEAIAAGLAVLTETMYRLAKE